MISRIEGELLSVDRGRVELRCGAFTYELRVPAADEERLSGLLGEPVEFHALHYLESQGQGAAYVPRLIGFGSAEERAFFEILTTVKGLGTRKALRALGLPHSRIAEAIVNKDIALLISLPEIGRRTAETMVVQLHGKVDRFAELKPQAEGVLGADRPPFVRDAIAVLRRLGEPDGQARRLIDRALASDPALETADELVTAACRLKEVG